MLPEPGLGPRELLARRRGFRVLAVPNLTTSS